MVALRLALLVVLLAAASWWPAAAAAAPLPQSSPCATAVAAAIAKRGAPYQWGAKGPASFDCSGLTYYAWLQAGVNIGLSTYDQAVRGVSIPCRLSDLAGANTTCWQPGDLIFLRYVGGQHVAMYIGNGLFADAYNTQTGVIIHNVAADDYYWQHFWQARRIVDCGETAVNVPAADSSPQTIPALEEIPDIVGDVSFSVPQCGSCGLDGFILLPPTEWGQQWPSGLELLNLGLVFQTVISWLAWQIGELIRQLICWLLSMLSTLATILAIAVNALIYGVNSLFKMLVLTWLSLKAYFLAAWDIFESMRELLFSVAGGLEGLATFGQLIADVVLLLLSLIGRLLALLGMLALSIIGMVGWIGGLVIGFWLSLQLALAGTTMPAQLAGEHIIYRAIRGTLEGARDSEIGWAFVLLWGMAYVGFVTWLARFLSASKEAQ